METNQTAAADPIVIDWSADTDADLIELAQEYARCEASALHVGAEALAAEYAGYVRQIQAEAARRNINIARIAS